MVRTKNFADVIRKRLAANPKLAARVERQAFNFSVAEAIYEARVAAGLTQTRLAEAIGTRQSVIARLENADYEGHTVTMLRKIGMAVGMDLQIEFVPKAGSAAARQEGSPKRADSARPRRKTSPAKRRTPASRR